MSSTDRKQRQQVKSLNSSRHGKGSRARTTNRKMLAYAVENRENMGNMQHREPNAPLTPQKCFSATFDPFSHHLASHPNTSSKPDLFNKANNHGIWQFYTNLNPQVRNRSRGKSSADALKTKQPFGNRGVGAGAHETHPSSIAELLRAGARMTMIHSKRKRG
ncbi:hypothetical protein NA56DRAFT_712774 [Hyaloscypha hepaticicola]|uniref:Uncharacterized protein n=1 Tax=Hyaloscypha hepaticicola TaxID=2082293 RepID=A0A2J6PF87_9HELO|nr:hypothetical protein NA56DRAFT_712774 [Hyaloscypha hepaticicola]